jgi:excisionase family DNA binding protein
MRDIGDPNAGGELGTEIFKMVEVAAYLRLSRSQCYYMVRRGAIPRFGVGGQPFVRRADLLNWIDQNSSCSSYAVVGDVCGKVSSGHFMKHLKNKAGMDGSRTHLSLLRSGTTVLKTAATTR